jgi:periplasmic mercuric ion binding protein
MNLRTLSIGLAAAFSMIVSAGAWAQQTATLSEVHMCCGACVNGASAAVKSVPGATAVPSMADSTIVITAADKDSVQKAVDALVAKGFYGKSSDSAIKMEAPSGATDGKVEKLEVAGVHLCCNKCVTDVKAALKEVPGVTGDTVVQKATTFTVTGNFEPKALFQSLNNAGLAGRVATPAAAPTAP